MSAAVLFYSTTAAAAAAAGATAAGLHTRPVDRAKRKCSEHDRREDDSCVLLRLRLPTCQVLCLRLLPHVQRPTPNAYLSTVHL